MQNISGLDAELERRTRAMSKARYDKQLRLAIYGVLLSEGAIDLGDAELNRCLSGCVMPGLPGLAKQYRDTGSMSVETLDALRGSSSGWAELHDDIGASHPAVFKFPMAPASTPAA